MYRVGWKKIRDLKKGDYFTLCKDSNPDALDVRVRGDCMVYVDFIF